MLLAVVKGNATSTRKHPTLVGQRLLVCLTLDRAGRAGGDPMLVVDQLGADIGSTVLLSSDGLGLRDLLRSTTSPARWFTLGLVDEDRDHG